jgi:membrane protein DedA with SNARE-associated domain
MISKIAIFLYSIIKDLGYIGIFIGMTIESSLFPFPSEIIMIPAGALVAKNEMNFILVFLAGVIGSLVGAIINYFLGFFIGRTSLEFLISKYKRNFFLNQKKLEKTDLYFNKYGEITTLIGRLIPGIRQIISIPAGFSKMNFLKFCLFTLIGAGIWNLILISTGYFLGNNIQWLNQNTEIIITIILFIFTVFFIYKKINFKKILHSKK